MLPPPLRDHRRLIDYLLDPRVRELLVRTALLLLPHVFVQILNALVVGDAAENQLQQPVPFIARGSPSIAFKQMEKSSESLCQMTIANRQPTFWQQEGGLTQAGPVS